MFCLPFSTMLSAFELSVITAEIVIILSVTALNRQLSQGILKGEVSLYHWPPVWLVWNQLYDHWQFLFLFSKQTNPNQSNRGSTVQWYFPFSIPWLSAVTLKMTTISTVMTLNSMVLSIVENDRQNNVLNATFNRMMHDKDASLLQYEINYNHPRFCPFI